MPSETTIAVDGREVRISSPDRVLWKDPGISKLDLAKYLVEVGEAFVTANGGRPVSLERYQSGVDGESFFSKNPPKGAPELTSGNRGLHVFAPIEPSHEFLDVRHAVIAIARELERRLPETVTTNWWKEERGARMFVDYNQANRDRTMAGAYSPRALAHAPVSAPITWDELEHTDPREHTILTVPARLRALGDPWADMHARPGRIDAALAWWNRDLENGLGELPFPPDFPKMPGEPPRVQPSRAKKAE